MFVGSSGFLVRFFLPTTDILPVTVPPVKETRETAGCDTSAAPVCAPPNLQLSERDNREIEKLKPSGEKKNKQTNKQTTNKQTNTEQTTRRELMT